MAAQNTPLLLLVLLLASCGGGGGGEGATATPPAVATTLALSTSASQVLSGSQPVTLTASTSPAATTSWSIDQGPGTLSASSGAGVSYSPPASVAVNTPVVIRASAGNASQTVRLTLYPDPGAPGLSLITGTLGGAGSLDGQGRAARFSDIRAASADAAGNLWLLDDHLVRRVSADGTVTTPFPNGLNGWDLSVAPDGPVLLLSVSGSERTFVSQLQPDGTLQTWLDDSHTFRGTQRIVAGAGAGAYLVGANGVYVASKNGSSSLLAGGDIGDPSVPCRDGQGAQARFGNIKDAVLGRNGALLLFDCNSVRQVTPGATVTTLAGDLSAHDDDADGRGAAAHFDSAFQGSLAASGNGTIRVLETEIVTEANTAAIEKLGRRYRLRQITPDGVVSTLAAGVQPFSPGAYDPLNAPGVPSTWQRLRYLSNGTTMLTSVRSLTLLDDAGQPTLQVGDEGDVLGEVTGPAAQARFQKLISVCADLAGNLYLLDAPPGDRLGVFKLSPAGIVSQLYEGPITMGNQIIATPDGALYLVYDTQQDSYPRSHYGGSAIYKLGADGTPQLFAGSTAQVTDSGADGPGLQAVFYQARLLGYDNDSNLYVADLYASTGHPARYRKITPQGVVSTISTVPDSVGAAPDGYHYDSGSQLNGVYRVAADGSRTTISPGMAGNRPGALPGSLAWPVKVAPIGPSSFAVISGAALLKLVLPH